MVLLRRDAAREFAESLPDDPYTFNARCLLLRELGEAWVEAAPEGVRASLIRDLSQPSELFALGEDPEALWSLLREVPGWDCVNVDASQAADLGELLARRLASPTELVSETYFVLSRAPAEYRHPHVRRLTEDDLALVESAPKELRPSGYGSDLAALAGGIVAGAIVDDRLVGSVTMTASSETYGNLGAHTLGAWRGQGIAAAAAYLVAREAIDRGLEPVWSTADANRPSRRVAEKLGFERVGARTYVVVPGLRGTGGFRPRPS